MLTIIFQVKLIKFDTDYLFIVKIDNFPFYIVIKFPLLNQIDFVRWTTSKSRKVLANNVEQELILI